MLTQKLDRASWVLENRVAIEKVADQIARALQGVRSRFVESASVESFQLETQQKVNQIASSRLVRINVFEWVLDESVGDGFGHRSRARMMVMGKIGDLAAFQTEIETAFPVSSVVDASFGSSNSDTGSSGTLSVIMDFHFIRSSTVVERGAGQ